MRIAISIPDRLSKELDRLARSSSRSRSELVNAALADYMARHDLDEVTEAMSRVCVDIDDHPDTFAADAGRRVLGKTEWTCVLLRGRVYKRVGSQRETGNAIRHALLT